MLLSRSRVLVVALLTSWLSIGGDDLLADASRTDARKIESLTPEQAKALVAEQAFDADHAHHVLRIDRVATLDAATAKALAEFKGKRLSLDGLTTLDVDTATALGEFQGQELLLNGLAALPAETAKSLGGFKGAVLSLNGLTTLDVDAAKVLAQFKCNALWLNGLTMIEADTARALAEFRGAWLSLDGLATLDVDTARALAAIDTWNGVLTAITTLDSPDAVAIATALATRKGPLSLPNLEKISPKTLTALLAKPDVEIPLIDTLEFIQEPDGSVTEDFVIPDGFRQREMRNPRLR